MIETNWDRNSEEKMDRDRSQFKEIELSLQYESV